MSRGSVSLDNREYDNWLVENKKERELVQRSSQRRDANKGYKGWHFGVGEKPIFAKDKKDYQRQLNECGLMLRDDIKRTLK